MAPSTTQSPSRPVSDPLKCSAIFFFAALFFLCGADQYFATRVGGFNFRWGQLLLLALVPFSLKRSWGLLRDRSKDRILIGKILKYWGIFLAVYALTALLSDNPKITLIKWVWGLFNIGCAALVLLDKRWGDSLKKGFLFGATALALLVWAQAIAVYWLGATASSADWRFTYPLLIQGLPFPLGYVQPGPLFIKFPILRMDAFYYEPSYAGCALAFAFPLVLLTERQLAPKPFPFHSALVLSSILLVGSRSGILGVFVGFLSFLAYVQWNHLSEVKPFFWKTVGAAFMAIILFGLSTDSRKYMAFTFGLFQDQISYGQLTDTHTSEGGRMVSMLRALRLWKQHPLLGNGIPKNSSGGQKVTVTTDNMWLEIGMESGLIGFLAFLGAIGGTMWMAWGTGPPSALKGLVLAAWVTHFAINMNFCQTFPRLDFWLFFFFSIRLLIESGPIQTVREKASTLI
jgi:hypothetical protein